MEIFKIAIAGNVGAGKTTFIRSISEIEVVSTERSATDGVASLKKDTTVAMDFGKLTLNETQVLHIYGTPGQSRFDFMWEIIIAKAHAWVMLVDAHRPEDFRSCRQILSFMTRKVQIPMIIGLTHMDCEGAWETEDIALALGYRHADRRPLIVSVNAEEPRSVARCLMVLLQQMLSPALIN
jgi:uncharacterized protein